MHLTSGLYDSMFVQRRYIAAAIPLHILLEITVLITPSPLNDHRSRLKVNVFFISIWKSLFFLFFHKMPSSLILCLPCPSNSPGYSHRQAHSVHILAVLRDGIVWWLYFVRRGTVLFVPRSLSPRIILCP